MGAPLCAALSALWVHQVGLTEEGAFWLLKHTVEDSLDGYFSPTIRTLRVDLRVFSDLVRAQLQCCCSG